MGLITRNWFSDDLDLQWRPTQYRSFNKFFYHQLNEVRKAYQLKPIRFGLDTSNYLRPVYARGRYAYAMLEKLEWANWKEYKTHTEIFFSFILSLSVERTASSAQTPRFQEVIWAPLITTFPRGYPKTKPSTKVNTDFNQGGQRVWRWNLGSKICTMNDRADWNAANNTMLNVIDSMVDWLAANHFGPDDEEGGR